MKNKKSIFLLIGIIFYLTFAMIAGAVDITDDYSENFENDTAGSDPSESWYTYIDSAWDTVQVDEIFYRSANHSYNIEDENGLGDFSHFNWTSANTNYLEFYFLIHNDSHDYGCVCPSHTAGSRGVGINIYGNLTYEPTVRFMNYTITAFNLTISNNTWYRCRFDFNYSTDEIRCRIYDNSSVLKADDWLLADPEAGAYDFSDVTGMAILSGNSQSSSMYFDNIVMSYTYEYTMEASSPNYLLVIGLVLLALVILFAAIKSVETIDSTFIIMLLLSIILIIVAVQMVFQIGSGT